MHDVPTPDKLALYVESLKLQLKKTKSPLAKEVLHAIESLPPANAVRKLGSEECVVLFETIGWLWKNISGEDINEKEKKSEPIEFFMGHYWILKNGMFLEGVNHYTIIKQNINLFSQILNVDSSVFLHAMSIGDNEKLIFTAIANGAIRAFFNDKKECFAQMSAKTYGDWGRNKIQKLDFPKKHIKIIDVNKPYVGWDTGIFVKVN